MAGHRKTKALMLLFPLLWGISFIAGKVAVRDFTPEVTSFLRFLIASVALFPFAFREPSTPGAFAPRRLLILFLLGFTGIFAYHVLFYYSLRYTSAGNSSLIISTDSLMTVGLAVVFLRERLTWRKSSGIALGFLGVVWIVSDGALVRLVSNGPNRGDALALGAALARAIYSVL
ncbi:MAG: DMT family transporter, partial [Thermoanaerobaculales bacterium]